MLMKKTSRNIFITQLALLTVLGIGVYGISRTHAQSNENKMSIVQKIAEKFNLSSDEVQKVFDEDHHEREQQMQATFEKTLSEAVSKGELTEAQKQLIINKRADMQKQREADRESVKNLSQDEMKTKMDKEHADLQQWCKDNGVDQKYLMGFRGHGGHGGPDGMNGLRPDENLEK